MSMYDDVYPNSVETEAALLGTIMSDKRLLCQAMNKVTQDTFFSTKHKVIFLAIKKLFEKKVPIDLMSVSNMVEESKQMDILGGAHFIAGLCEYIVSSVGHHIDKLLDLEARRKAIEVIDKLRYEYQNNREKRSEKITNEGITELLSTRKKKNNKVKHISEVLPDVFDDIDKRMRPNFKPEYLFGFPELDEHLFVERGDTIVIGGRPSMGKSAITAKFVRNMAKTGKVCLFFNLESSNKNEVKRALFTESKLNLMLFNKGSMPKDDLKKLSGTASDLSELPILYDDSSNITPIHIYSSCLEAINDYGRLDLIIVDFIQIMGCDKGLTDPTERISTASKAIKNIGKDLNIPQIIVSQILRQRDEKIKKQSVPRPTLSDLKGSGAIEENADQIIFIHRPEQYMSRGSAVDNGVVNMAELIIAKNKNGPANKIIEMLFIKEFMLLDQYVNSVKYNSDTWQDKF